LSDSNSSFISNQVSNPPPGQVSGSTDASQRQQSYNNANRDEAILSIRSLYKSYYDASILQDINLDINSGDFLVLVGPSGCGKSTLLSCIGGLTDVTSGEIYCKGKDISQLDPAKRDIAMVFQSYALFPNMTVAQNIGFGLEVRKVPAAKRTKKIQQVAEILHLEPLLDRTPAQLSGGQRQRVAMGRALVRDPTLFLFDEPLSNLDAKLRLTMRTEIKHLHQRLGGTMVYVTHDQVEAMTLASKIVVLNQGVIQQFGTPDEVYKRPANTFVAEFMGSPAMNLMQAKVLVEAGDLKIQIQREDEPPIIFSEPAATDALRAFANRSVIVGLRPESISDLPARDPQRSHSVDCRIDYLEGIGSDVYATLKIAGGDVVSRLHGDSSVRAGDRQQLHFDLSNISYFDPSSQLRI